MARDARPDGAGPEASGAAGGDVAGGRAQVRTLVARRYPALAPALAARGDAGEPTIHDAATAAVEGRDAGRPVDPAVRGPVEAHLAADLTGARVHDDPLAQQASAAMGARAFAHGSDVFLGPGESDRDLELMAHELTHVVQQGSAGQRTPQRAVQVGDAHSPAETQADAVAGAVTSGIAAPAALLVDDGPVQPGQMLKSQFLDQLRPLVTAVADTELGPIYSAIGCPYIDRYFGRYTHESAAAGEALLKRFAPATRSACTAADMIPAVLERVRAGVRIWRETGEPPPEIAAVEPAAAAAGPQAAQLLRAPDGRETLASLEADLGPGRPLDSAAAQRMADGLGTDVSRARIHTGAEAARKAADAGALAFAVGEHVVMGADAPAAGSVAGDALLAHELAHVEQQSDAAADPVARRQPIAGESAAAEEGADRAAGSALARLWGGAKQAARRIVGAGGGLSLQRCPAPTDKASATEAAALKKELGVSVTTFPEVGGSKTGYVGGQIQFGVHFAKVPTRKVQATLWDLRVPGGGGWSTVPTGPTTMLPMTQVGPHRFVVTIEVDDGIAFEVEHEFEVIDPKTKTDELTKDQDPISLSQFQSQMALQKALLSPPGSADQGQGGVLHVATSAPNPAIQTDKDPIKLSYKIEDREPAGGGYHWYAKPFRWDGLPAKLGDHAKVAIEEGDAYDLGTGKSASFPASHQGTFLVLCRANGADGKPRGDARYLQSVLGEKEAKAVEKLVEHEGRVAGLAERFEGPTVPVIGSHLAVQTGTETALRLYLGKAKGNPDKWLLIDMTAGLDPEQNELEFDGGSVDSVLEEFEDDNKYPLGAISLRIDANAIGAPAQTRRFDTDGKTILGSLSSKAGLLSIILGLGAVLAAPFTGGGSLLVTALIIGSATAAATAGVLSLAEHLQTEEISETAVALDILTIVTSFLNAGLAVKAMRGGPGMILATRGGRFLLWTNFALEGVSAILVGVEGVEQIIKIVESDAAPDEKMRAMVAVVANLILTGTLLAISYGDIKATRGRVGKQLGKVTDDLADADTLTLAMLDDTTLASLKKADGKQLNRLADMLRDDSAAIARIAGRADLLDALKLARGSKALDLELAFLQLRLKKAGVGTTESDRLIKAMSDAGVSPSRVPDYPDAGLTRLADPAVLDQLEEVSKLQKGGRIKGVDDWIDATKTGATAADELALELREAIRQSKARPDAVIHIGGDNRAPTRPGTTESMKSFDMAVETAGGKVKASIEVTGIAKPLRSGNQITPGVEHGIEKVRSRTADKQPIPGPHEVTITVTLAKPSTSKAGTQTIDPITGEKALVTKQTPPVKVAQGNIYDDMATHLPTLTDHQMLDVVTLVDATSGTVLVTLTRKGNTWKVVR